MSNKNVYDSNLNPLLLYYQTILGEKERDRYYWKTWDLHLKQKHPTK